MSNWKLGEEECLKIINAEPVKINDSEHIKDLFKSKEEQLELCRKIVRNRRVAMDRCPNCNIEWFVCDEECCGGTEYCLNCGLEKEETEHTN